MAGEAAGNVNLKPLKDVGVQALLLVEMAIDVADTSMVTGPPLIGPHSVGVSPPPLPERFTSMPAPTVLLAVLRTVDASGYNQSIVNGCRQRSGPTPCRAWPEKGPAHRKFVFP